MSKISTIRIPLNGNKTLNTNKAHIDTTFSSYDKNNAPFVNETLQPHYIKEIIRRGQEVYDKSGNAYYVSNGFLYKNENIISAVNTESFSIEDIEEKYDQCNNEGTLGIASIQGNTLKYVDFTLQLNINPLHSRVRIIDDVAYFVLIYKDANVLKTKIIKSDGTTYNEYNKDISWGRLVSGTTWTTVTDDSLVRTFRINIAKLVTRDGNEDTIVGISLIGNAFFNNKEEDLYFYNMVVYEGEIYAGAALDWEGAAGEIEIHRSLQSQYHLTLTKTKELVTDVLLYKFRNLYYDREWKVEQVARDVLNGHSASVNPTTPPTGYSCVKTSTGEKTYTVYPDSPSSPIAQSGSVVARIDVVRFYVFKYTFKWTLTSTNANSDYDTDVTVRWNDDTENATAVLIKNKTSCDVTRAISNKDWDTFNTEVLKFMDSDAYISMNDLFLQFNHNVIAFNGQEDIFSEGFTMDLTDYTNPGENVNHTWEWAESKEQEAPAVLCNMFEDSGILRSIPYLQYKDTVSQYLVKCSPFSFSVEDNIATLVFVPDSVFNNNNVYNKYSGAAYNIHQKYFDVCLSVTNTSYSENKTHNIYNNPGLVNDFICDVGVLNDGTKPYENSSNKSPLWYNADGSIAPIDGTLWRLLYNSNGITNISYGDFDCEGTALWDWNTIDSDFYISVKIDEIMFKDISGIHRICINGNVPTVSMFENRFVVINTTSYLNCYDIENDKMLHWASDYNNRVHTGFKASDYSFFISTSYSDAIDANTWESENASTAFAAGQNINYEITGNPIASSMFATRNYFHLVEGKETYIFGSNAEVDIYYGSTYRYTIKNNELKYVNSILYPNAIFTSNIYYNIPLLADILYTYNNKDMVKSGKSYYNIKYNGNVPTTLYAMTGGIESADNLFVIQSQYYAVMGNKICAVSYSGDIVDGTSAIIDVSGMQFLGYMPTFALFFSPMNKCIYRFTGDANLEKLLDAQEITTIKKCYYNTSTEVIYVVTPEKVYLIGNTIYSIDIPNVEDIFFTNNEISILETSEKVYSLAYYKLTNDYKVIPLIWETEFYGQENDLTSNIAKWMLRFIKNGDSNGVIKIKSTTLTDKGCEEESVIKNIKDIDWDKISESLYVSFVPKNSKATGHKLYVESDFPLASVIVQATSDGSFNNATNVVKI